MRCWLPILILLPTLQTQADERADKLASAGVAEFNAAYQAWDGARLGAAAELFRQASAKVPTASRFYYWLGVAQFHRMLQLQSTPAANTNQLAADAAMEAALEALSRAVKLDEEHAESHALLGTIYGMKINGNWLRAAKFGPRVQKHCKQAMQFGADNPRVRYLIGTCQFFTAKKAAAQREALATLLKAEQLFEAEAKVALGPLEPRWGHDSCLVFIGRTCESLGQRTEAAVYFRKALTLRPDDYLAKEGLERVTEKR